MRINKQYVDEHIQDTRILYVPIVSSINRKTNQYNLDTDGNVARFITFFEAHKNFSELYVILPLNNESHSMIEEWEKDYTNIHILWSENFGKHAGEQRKDETVVNNMFSDIKSIIDNKAYDIDLLMFESQGIGLKLMDCNDLGKIETVYWCPVCKIDDNHTRSFLEGYDKTNTKLFDFADWSIVESPMQVEKFGSKTGYPYVYPYYKMSDRNLKYFNYLTEFQLKDSIKWLKRAGYSIYYLPYRITDEGYKLESVIKFINHDVSDKVIVYYTDPNNSGYMEELKDKFNDNIELVKFYTYKSCHFTMLSCEEVIVPYFEDLDFVNHALLWEMMSPRSNCQFAITKEQWDKDKKSEYNLKLCDRCFYIDIENI